MTIPKITDVVAQIVDLLTPFSPEERKRTIGASLTLLGDSPTDYQRRTDLDEHGPEDDGSFSPRAKVWMKQNAVSSADIQQVFHIADGAVEVIASEIPGANDKEKTYNAYILTGVAQLLITGNPSFDDKGARALCRSSGCFNAANHSAYLNDRRNEFTGTKERGWTLTAPGLKRGAAIVKELNQAEK